MDVVWNDIHCVSMPMPSYVHNNGSGNEPPLLAKNSTIYFSKMYPYKDLFRFSALSVS